MRERREFSPRMLGLISGLIDDWVWMTKRIDAVSREIEEFSEREADCRRLMTRSQAPAR